MRIKLLIDISAQVTSQIVLPIPKLFAMNENKDIFKKDKLSLYF